MSFKSVREKMDKLNMKNIRQSFNEDQAVLKSDKTFTKPDTAWIALELRKAGKMSHSRGIEGSITEALIEAINADLCKWTEEVIAELEKLEMSQGSEGDYAEKLGMDEDYRISLNDCKG